MDVTRGLRRLVSAAALVAALLLAPAPVLADCQPAVREEAVKTAAFVFVGTVERAEAEGMTADVTVLEVWRGDVAARIVVDGGLDITAPAEDDRRFEAGVTYLFVPSILEGHFVDSICSATAPWDEATMAGLRPPELTAPEPLPGTGSEAGPLAALGDLAGPVLVVSVIGGLLLVTVLLARRREA